MARNAVVAPRGSPFLTELGNLTPAWHHYLANVEKLTRGLGSTIDGARLLELGAQIDALEALIGLAEVELAKRNWTFFYTDRAPVDDSSINAHCIVAHGLNTRKFLARVVDRFGTDGGEPRNSFAANIVDEDTIDFVMSGATYQGNGFAEAWVLGLYD